MYLVCCGLKYQCYSYDEMSEAIMEARERGGVVVWMDYGTWRILTPQVENVWKWENY